MGKGHAQTCQSVALSVLMYTFVISTLAIITAIKLIPRKMYSMYESFCKLYRWFHIIIFSIFYILFNCLFHDHFDLIEKSNKCSVINAY